MSRNRGVEAGAEDALRSTSWPGVGGRGLVLTFISVNPPTAGQPGGTCKGSRAEVMSSPRAELGACPSHREPCPHPAAPPGWGCRRKPNSNQLPFLPQEEDQSLGA